MFLNPFEQKKKRSNNKPVILPKIIADIHEKDSMIFSELKSSGEVEISIEPLKIGDYQIKNTVLERKTVQDFVSSMISGRLKEQLEQMKCFEEKILIIEGDFEFSTLRSKINPNSIKGFILSIILNHKIPIIQTRDIKDTAEFLILLAKQKEKTVTESSSHSRIPKTIEEQKQYILESFPNIGPKKAKKLLEKFKNLENIFNAKEEDLNEILKNQAKDFKDILNHD